MKHSVLVFVFFLSVSIHSFAQNSDSLTVIKQEDVIITGEYAPSDVRSTLHSAKIISALEIQKRGAISLADVLAQESNIRIQNDPILGSSMTLNGLSGRNIKFLLNGVPIIGRQNGNIDLSQINVFNIQRIEIIEGPMALLYGSDAIAGVVNIITKQYGQKKYSVETQVRGETRAANVASLAIGYLSNTEHSFRVAGGYSQFQGWNDNDTSRNFIWNPKKQGYLQANWTYENSKKLKIQAMVEGMDEKIINKGEIRRPQFKPYAFDDNYLTRKVHSQFSVEIPINESHFFSVLGGAEKYIRNKITYRTDLSNNEQTLQGTESDTSIFDMQMLRTLYVWKINKKFTLQSGFNAQFDKGIGKRLADSTGQKSKNMQDYALFTSLKWHISPSFQVETGIRGTYNSSVKVPLIPSLHLKYDIPKRQISLRASYTQGFRTPDFKELYFQFIDFNHNIIGNPELRPERAQSFGLSITKDKEIHNLRLNGNIRLFFNDINNKIDLYEYKIVNGIKTPVTDTTTLAYSYFNIEKYQTFGANMSLKIGNEWLQTSLNFSPIAYLNPNYSTLGVKPYNLATNLQGEISFSHPKWKTSLQTYHNWNDKQISFYEEKIKGETLVIQRIIKGYLASDIVLAQPFFHEKLRISIGVKNCWNVQKLNVMGTSSNQAHISNSQTNLGPGRSYWLQVNLNL